MRKNFNGQNIHYVEKDKHFHKFLEWRKAYNYCYFCEGEDLFIHEGLIEQRFIGNPCWELVRIKQVMCLTCYNIQNYLVEVQDIGGNIVSMQTNGVKNEDV